MQLNLQTARARSDFAVQLGEQWIDEDDVPQVTLTIQADGLGAVNKLARVAPFHAEAHFRQDLLVALK